MRTIDAASYDFAAPPNCHSRPDPYGDEFFRGVEGPLVTQEQSAQRTVVEAQVASGVTALLYEIQSREPQFTTVPNFA